MSPPSPSPPAPPTGGDPQATSALSATLAGLLNRLLQGTALRWALVGALAGFWVVLLTFSLGLTREVADLSGAKTSALGAPLSTAFVPAAYQSSGPMTSFAVPAAFSISSPSQVALEAAEANNRWREASNDLRVKEKAALDADAKAKALAKWAEEAKGEGAREAKWKAEEAKSSAASAAAEAKKARENENNLREQAKVKATARDKETKAVNDRAVLVGRVAAILGALVPLLAIVPVAFAWFQLLRLTKAAALLCIEVVLYGAPDQAGPPAAREPQATSEAAGPPPKSPFLDLTGALTSWFRFFALAWVAVLLVGALRVLLIVLVVQFAPPMPTAFPTVASF